MSNRAFSRIEALIVLAICGLLGTLLLPGIESIREVSRRNQCATQLRQLGLALLNYHDSFDSYPPAATWGSEGLNLAKLNTHEEPTPVHVTRQSWIQFLLPHVDQLRLASQFTIEKPITDDLNRTGRLTHVPSFKCPSDSFNTPSNLYEMKLPDGSVAHFSRGNYAINGGSEWVQAGFGTLSNPAPTTQRYFYSEKTREFRWWNNGLGGINISFCQNDIKNGHSTFVALEEVRAGLISIDPRGVWSLGQIGGSITWGHGMMGDAREPNSKEVNADDLLNGKEIARIFSKDFLIESGMPCCDHCNENAQATSRSLHSEGINACFLDGSIRFISNSVDHGFWHVIHSKDVPAKYISGDDFEKDIHGPSWNESPPQPPSKETAVQSVALPEITNSLGMKFVKIPAGAFIMGSPSDRREQVLYPDNLTPHAVEMSNAFYIGVHEVTQMEYLRIMGENPSWHSAAGEGLLYFTAKDTSRHPVENISWENAADFCRKLSNVSAEKSKRRSYRLPTEAEWEYSNRSGRTDIPSPDIFWEGSNPLGEIASKVKPTTEILTDPVMTFPPNKFGLYDMNGNVFEWVNDYYARDYYEKSSPIAPHGPDHGYIRMIRGWYTSAIGPYCKEYPAFEPGSRSPFIGFRVVMQINEKGP